MANNKLYDALIIPTGEPRVGEKKFPVTDEAVRAFDTGRYGCIFVTGGYNGFATSERKKAGISQAQETAEYLVEKDIPLEKIYFDGRSLEWIGSFTFPIVCPTHKNPSLLDFDNMEIFAQEGHMWRIMDYAKLAMQGKYIEGKLGFHALLGEHNNGIMAKVYHKGIMKALRGKCGVDEIHNFLMKEHPFYSKGWYNKSPTERKVEMGAVALSWFMK